MLGLISWNLATIFTFILRNFAKYSNEILRNKIKICEIQNKFLVWNFVSRNFVSTLLTGQHLVGKIVIPTPLLPSLLWRMHNNDNHPTKTQLRAKFDRMFYGIMVQQHIDDLYQDCYRCKATVVLPKQCASHSACTVVIHPGHYFHADVRR
jgi:hypothetical protein